MESASGAIGQRGGVGIVDLQRGKAVRQVADGWFASVLWSLGRARAYAYHGFGRKFSCSGARNVSRFTV